MAQQYQYYYAVIEEDGLCLEVRDTTVDYSDDPRFIPIPEYSNEYIFKYYLNGAWYEDAEGTIPWSPA